jgi:hypothetical protein
LQIFSFSNGVFCLFWEYGNMHGIVAEVEADEEPEGIVAPTLHHLSPGEPKIVTNANKLQLTKIPLQFQFLILG